MPARAVERLLPWKRGMTLLKSLVPLVVAVLLSACIELPEVADPESPPDSGVPDGGSNPDGGVPADTTPPAITAASPAHGSTNVTITPLFLFTFSEPMNVSTVQVNIAPSVTLTSPTWANRNTELTLQPIAALAQNTTYTLAIDGKDVAGNALTDRKLFSFSTTGPAPDTTPPTVLDFTPAPGAIGIARSASITVRFSEPMDKASAQTAFAITSPSGFNSGVFDWNTAGTEMTFNPDADFPYGTTVDWRVSTAAKDAAGNALGTNVSASFRAVRVNTVTINYDPPTSGTAYSPDYWRQTYVFLGATVGDSGSGMGSAARLLLGFRLDTLPEDLTQIAACRLKWYVDGQYGEPFSVLGRLLLERVYIGEAIGTSTMEWTNPLSRAQYESSALDTPIIVPSSVVTNDGIFDVTSWARLDWQERASRGTKRSQFRLRFEIPNDNDTMNDVVYTDEAAPTLAELEVTYEYP
jgi:hypothetical protein